MSSHKYTPVKMKALIQLGFEKIITIIRNYGFFLLSSYEDKHEKGK